MPMQGTDVIAAHEQSACHFSVMLVILDAARYSRAGCPVREGAA
jgi:hypothetical protein